MVKAQVRAYLAHTFKHRQFVRDVLTPKIHAIGIWTKNPFYEPDGKTKRREVAIADESSILGMNTSDIASNPNKTEKMEEWLILIGKANKDIVKRDLQAIDRTDFTIAYSTDISIGTMDEVFYAGVIKHRPVFLVTDNPAVYQHPWVIYSCRYGKIVKSIDELIKVLKKRYG